MLAKLRAVWNYPPTVYALCMGLAIFGLGADTWWTAIPPLSYMAFVAGIRRWGRPRG